VSAFTVMLWCVVFWIGFWIGVAELFG